MKSTLAVSLAASLLCSFAVGCQDSDYVDPTDPRTGANPAGTAIYSFNAANSPPFLNANLEATPALRAEFAVANGALVPIQAGAAFPASAGVDADLLDGVGFGTYANPDIQIAEWTAGSFQSVLTANVILSQTGDAVKFCRSFATTCVTARMTGDGTGLIVLDLAANIPDTEIGAIAPGISAAIRGTGPSGLTVALSDPSKVALPFTPAAGAPFELSWTIARGDTPGSLNYKVAVDGTELASGNTTAELASSIATDGGVVMIFDTPVGNDKSTDLDYSYEFEGQAGTFQDVLIGGNVVAGIDLSPQPGLGFAPLYVYPTTDPSIELLTLSGRAGASHAVQAEDGVVGGINALPGEKPQSSVYSTAFNGDDFAGVPGLEGNVIDQGGQGGGFYPSPSLCYEQVFATLEPLVAAGVQQEVHRQMYASIANGAALADGIFGPQLALITAPYTPLGNLPGGDIDAYVALGTDYADSNVETNIATSEEDTYTVTLANAASTTFRDELNGVLAELEADGDPFNDITIDNDQYVQLKTLQGGLNTPPGNQETFQENVDNALFVRINGIADDVANPLATNPIAELPILAAACLWGLPPQPAIPASDAVLTGNPATDAPAYAEIPAQPATPPARETAAASLNELVIGVFGNFVEQAFGNTVPASNFSLSMEVGDTTTGTAPAVTDFQISAQ